MKTEPRLLQATMAQDALQPASLFDLLSAFQLEQLEGTVVSLLWRVLTRIYPKLRHYSDLDTVARTLLNLLWMAVKQAPLAAWWYDLALRRKGSASSNWWPRFALVYALRRGLKWFVTSQRISPSVTVEIVLPSTATPTLRDWLPSWRQVDVAVDAFDIIATLLAGLQLSQQPSLVHWLGGVILGRPSVQDAALRLSQQRLFETQQQDYRAQISGLRRLLFDAGTAILDVRKLVIPVVSLLIMLADEPAESTQQSPLATMLPPPIVTDKATMPTVGAFKSCQQAGQATHDGCPLCGKDVQTPACLPTAGIVCCLACLQSRLETRAVCPFTNVRTQASAIIRLRE